MNLEEKVKVLNDFAKDWYSTSQADRIHAAIFRKQGLVKLADKCMEEAKEELEEAEKWFFRKLLDINTSKLIDYVI